MDAKISWKVERTLKKGNYVETSHVAYHTKALSFSRQTKRKFGRKQNMDAMWCEMLRKNIVPQFRRPSERNPSIFIKFPGRRRVLRFDYMGDEKLRLRRSARRTNRKQMVVETLP